MVRQFLSFLCTISQVLTLCLHTVYEHLKLQHIEKVVMQVET